MKFVANYFYVDDALTSLPTPAEAISLLKRTRNDLQRPYRYWPTEWSVTCAEKSRLKLDLNNDTFVFTVSSEGKPFTTRGVSIINSIFDPVGFLSPVTIQGRLIIRDLTINTKGWDEPLPDTHYGFLIGKSKVVPVVPLFSTEHSKGKKYWLFFRN